MVINQKSQFIKVKILVDIYINISININALKQNIQVEVTFGVLKHNYRFRRFLLREKNNIRNKFTNISVNRIKWYFKYIVSRNVSISK